MSHSFAYLLIQDLVKVNFFILTAAFYKKVIFISFGLLFALVDRVAGQVFNMSSDGSGVWNNEITRNKFVWIAIFICSGLTLMVFAIPGMRLVLGLSVLPLKIWLTAIATGMLPLVVIRASKAIRKKNNKLRD